VFNLQGLVLFALYMAGIAQRAAGGWVMKKLAPRRECAADDGAARRTAGRTCATCCIGLWERA
jgi:ferrous iron transport protein B